jgi:hypothetical protein
MNKIKHLIKATIVVFAITLSVPLFGSVIYDNTGNDLTNRFHPGTLEVGDEITLAETARFLTNFSFEYFGTNASGGGNFSGNVQVRVRFYLNTGPLFNSYATPTNAFFDSGLFSISTTPRSIVNYGPSDFNGGLFMPVASNFTWSVQFQGMGVSDDVGVDLFSPPIVGQNTPDYWENSGAGWSLRTNAIPINFAARFEAMVPEPTIISLAILGGLTGLFFRFRRHR